LTVTLVDLPKRGRATSASAGGLWPLGESLGLGCGVIFYKALVAEGKAEHSVTGPQPLPRCFLDLALKSNAMFVPLVGELEETAGIDVEYEDNSLLFVMFDEADEMFAHALLSAPDAADYSMELVSSADLAATEPAINRETRGAVRMIGDNQLNPYKFTDALRLGAGKLGARVLNNTEVTGLIRREDRVVGADTSAGRLEADWVINAAGAWAGELAASMGLTMPVYPVRGQIVCTETLPTDTLGACLSTSDCYLAQKGNGEIIIGSTTENVGFEYGVTASAITDLVRGAVRCLPFLKDVAVKRVWAGFRPGSPDELPILGPVDGYEGYLNATGHFRTGILNAPITAEMLTALMVGETPPLPIEPFLLSRFSEEERQS
jgi:hydrogen cyanide synthase HcnC